MALNFLNENAFFIFLNPVNTSILTIRLDLIVSGKINITKSKLITTKAIAR